jgi:hypothetical protein
MSISSEVRRAGPYSGNGSTTAFAFAFKVFNTSQVVVTRTVSGVETVLTLTTHYTVALNSNQNTNPGGTVTMLSAPAVGQSITITSNVANLQPTAIANLGGFYPEVINDSLDRATIQIQQLDERVDRALVVPVSTSGVNTQLPVPAAGALIGWDASGTTLQNYNSVPIGGTIYQYVHRTIATAGQTAIVLPVSYTVGANALSVFINGLRVELGAGLDYVETNSTTITFNSGLAAGDLVVIGVQTNAAATSPNFIDNIAALRLLNATTNANQIVLARNYVAGDGGGIYRYDASDTTTADNGATVIVDAASRRWKRQFTGVNVARTSVFQTFQAALTAVSAGGVVIIDKDETITTPVTATITGNVLVVSDGYHLITFNVSGHSSDLITITPNNYETFRISGPLIFDCGATGRHFFAMTSGTPEMADVTINNSYYDCFHFPLTSNYRWVENFRLERCRFNDVGRNVWSVTMTGTLAVFLNETIWYECELRGLARRAVGRVLHVTYTNANAVGAKVSGWKIIGGNYDAQQAGSLTSNSVDHFIYLEHTAGNAGIFSDLFIASGGIESTTGTVTGKKFIETSGTVTVGLVNSQCWIAYNWVFTPNDTILNQVGTTWLYNDTEAYAPRYKAKPNGIIFQGDGAGRITGVRNAGIGFQTEQLMTASTPFTIDIPITTTGDYTFFADLIVEMTHTNYWATIDSRGIWRVSAMRDASTNQVDAQLITSVTSGAAYGFNASTGVAWSRPNATTVRATVTPGANVGDGGRNVLMRCAVGKTAGIIGNTQLTSETL